MSLNIDPRASAVDPAATPSAEATIWQHAAFCEIALPIRAPRGAWQREVATVAIQIEPGATGHALPSGPLLRLAILHICDRAFRTGSAVVDLGESDAVLAAQLGVDARELAEQVARMLAAKITVTLDGGPALTIFDARSRPRAAGSAWRPSIRLNGGFFASLADHVVPLERRIVELLRDQPAALDAYAWIRQTLRRQAAGPIITTSWDELLKRFGTSSQDMAGFRQGFEAALRAVFDADLSISLAVDDDGVSVEHAAARTEEAPAAGDPDAAPPVSKAAEPVPPAASAPPPPSPKPAAEAAPPAATAAIPSAEPKAPEPAQQAATSPPPNGGTAQDTISLRSHMTGLTQVIWLRRGHGPDSPLVGVTPGTRFDADRLTVLAVEPMVMQISGGLNKQDFDLVSAWVMVNRDLIDGFWEGLITSFEEVGRRVRKVPALSARS
ncbi:replication protein RepA [Plastoroseomonas hellenica]|uniref:replication protein RepA n=1 Tax=Plastoroseomonas hellenica TaxID=2687306 RepID=UPI001BA7C5CB|nr:replication protein RepA [Plastoroseomonas hellenica]MBR0642297.1 hypothetical protein [Plastoroseomonas hellenica]